MGKSENVQDIAELVHAIIAAVGLTCRDKVIKVFNVSLQLYSNTV